MRAPAFFAVFLTSAALGSAATAAAQSGTTLTPDRLNFMVNKDVGAERWTINFNLHSPNPADVSNLTGNVFKSDGSPPSFILCQVRPDSEGSLTDPQSELRLRCRGTGPCESSAQRCSRNDWSEIPGADDVRLPVSFFLPPGGLAPATAAASAANRAPGGTGTPAQATDRGATLSLDALNLLVNKDVGGERWSISLNFLPVLDENGLVERRLTSVTGNVIRPDGSEPAFLYCATRDDSAGSLADPTSEFRFRCQAMDACETTAEECAASSWQTIADDVALPASFFLPPDGLTGAVQSDPDLVILGRTSGPPTIVAENFSLGAAGAAAAAARERPQGDACPVGDLCSVPQVGNCVSLNGEVVRLDDGRCGCQLADVPAGCLFCGSSACGESCEFPVGGSTARGFCLPFASNTTTCACFPIGAGETDPPVGACGGPLGASCLEGACCADDPLDGCDLASGDVDCAGVCVEADCPAGEDSCGICNADPVCGDGDKDAGEECDGADFGLRDCTDFGFFAGELACDDECRVDVSGCDGPSVTPGPCKGNTCE